MRDSRDVFRPAVGEIPTEPGVYRFLDSAGQILYIGKAKNLRARLSNYFQPLQSLPPRTRQMLSRAAGLDWTVVASETESLVLEQQWIRQHKPRYNVIFRDDKTFPYLAVTLGHEAPRLIITRREKIRGAKYFGPYPKVWALKETVALLNQTFLMRTCNDSDYRRAVDSGKPCLAGQIGKCHGPCSGRVSVAEYRDRARELVRFLGSLDRSRVQRLETEMFAAAAAHEFERAAKLRDQKTALETVIEANTIVLPYGTDADFFGLYADEISATVHQFIVRDGRVRGERSWTVDIELDTSEGELLLRVIQNAYTESDPPPRIYTSHEIPASGQLAAALREQRPRGGSVGFTVPERGDKAKLMQTAVRNAAENLTRYKLRRTNNLAARTDALAQLQEALGMPVAPLRIECVDVSHLQGTNVVASLVVFSDALPSKSEYRKYKIASTTDDTDSIYQVVTRRAQRMLKQEPADRPQLLIIDGGQPQVNAAARALREQGVTGVTLCSIAKRLEEIWLPGESFPVILPRSSEALFLVQRIRDEAHRFAITFQRQQRGRSVASELAEIPGLGAQRVRVLLRHFGSAKRVRAASVAELSAAPGIGDKLARHIYEVLHTGENNPAVAASGR